MWRLHSCPFLDVAGSYAETVVSFAGQSTRKPHSRASTIFRNELDAYRLKGTADSLPIRDGGRWHAVLSFRAPNSRHSHTGGDRQIFSAPTYQRSRRPYLSSGDLFQGVVDGAERRARAKNDWQCLELRP